MTRTNVYAALREQEMVELRTITPAQLRTARWKVGLTHACAAWHIGTKRETVCRWEMGTEKMPDTLIYLRAISKFIDEANAGVLSHLPKSTHYSPVAQHRFMPDTSGQYIRRCADCGARKAAPAHYRMAPAPRE